MAKTNVLVTGGAGFIGSHLCELLLNNNCSVTALDNFSTGKRDNVSHLVSNNKFTLIEGDATDYSLVEKLAENIQVIYHLAALVGVKKVMDEPINTIEVNHEATRNILRSALKNKARVIIASSSEVYGANPNLVFSEDDICMIGPTSYRRWCYSASKLLDEFHGLAYFYEKKLPVTIVRLFNTIGERQAGSYGMVVPTLIKQALAGEPITVFGTGEQKRCFTYVKDVANSLYLLACSNKAHGQVFNIGSTNEISINDLAKKIKLLTNSSSSIVYKGYKEAYGENFKDIERRYPDVSRLLNTIGYHPETSLDEALQKIIVSMKNK